MSICVRHIPTALFLASLSDFLVPNSLCNRNTTVCIFEELVSELQQIGGIGWEVREARSCLTNEGGLAGALDVKKVLTRKDSCDKACDNLETLIDEENLDPVSMIWAKKLVSYPKCR